jgi:hypothetical protein
MLGRHEAEADLQASPRDRERQRQEECEEKRGPNQVRRGGVATRGFIFISLYRLPVGWLREVRLWYGQTARASKSETEAWATGGERNALLSYPEEALFSGALCEQVANPSASTWQQPPQGEPAGRWQGPGAGPDEEVLSPVYPRDGRDGVPQKARQVCQGGSGSGGGQVCEGGGGESVGGFQAHWRWGGVLVTVPWTVLERVNGFPEDPAIRLFLFVFLFVLFLVLFFVFCLCFVYLVARALSA